MHGRVGRRTLPAGRRPGLRHGVCRTHRIRGGRTVPGEPRAAGSRPSGQAPGPIAPERWMPQRPLNGLSVPPAMEWGRGDLEGGHCPGPTVRRRTDRCGWDRSRPAAGRARSWPCACRTSAPWATTRRRPSSARFGWWGGRRPGGVGESARHGSRVASQRQRRQRACCAGSTAPGTDRGLLGPYPRSEACYPGAASLCAGRCPLLAVVRLSPWNSVLSVSPW